MNELWSQITASDRFWIGAQLLLFGASASAGIRTLRRVGFPNRNRLAIAVVPFAGAIGIAELARRTLGRNLTMAPTPVREGQLVDTGVYGVVRHPMYLSATLGLLAWAIGTGSSFAAYATPVAAVFFGAKARHEEALLESRYSDYAAYRQRVPGRLLPRTFRTGGRG